MQYKKIGIMLIGTILLAFGVSACGKKNVPKDVAEEETTTPIATPTASLTPTPIQGLDPDVQNLVWAIQASSAQPAFAINMDVHMKLNGSYINTEANMHSDVNVVQGEDQKNLQMTTVTTSDMDDVTSYAYYKDGWYYTDDKNGKNKLQKSPEEVLAGINQVTNIVINAAKSIEQMDISTDNDVKTYSYTIPASMAEDYLEQLAESAAAADTPLNGASANVDELQLVSTVSAQGVLIKQELQMTGSVSKLIFKIPAEVQMVAEFQQTDNTSLEMKTW